MAQECRSGNMPMWADLGYWTSWSIHVVGWWMWQVGWWFSNSQPAKEYLIIPRSWNVPNPYEIWTCYLAFSSRHVPVLIRSAHTYPWVCWVIHKGPPCGCDPVIPLPVPGAGVVRFNHPRLLQWMQRTGKPGFSPPLGIINKFIGELIKIAGG